MDGDSGYSLADLDYIGLLECAFDGEQWMCNIDTAFYYFENEDNLEEWSPNMEHRFPAIEKENLSQETSAIDDDYTFEHWDYHDVTEDNPQDWSPDMESWSPPLGRENLSEMTITMDGEYSEYTLSDLVRLGIWECWVDEELWICNIDPALDPYQFWSSNADSWSPDIERENLSEGNGIIFPVNPNLDYSRFPQDFGMERSRSQSFVHDSNMISIRYQENHHGPIKNSSFPLFPEPLATVSLLFLICGSFPLFCWLCYRCCFRNGAAISQRSELSEVLLSSKDVENTRNESTHSTVIV